MHSFSVYKLRNVINGKVYIGVTARGLDIRWKKHIYAGRNKRKPRISRAIDKWGADNFTIESVATGLSRSIAYDMEMKLICALRCSEPARGYNMSTGGENSRIGCKHSDETKRKIGTTSRGRPSARKGTKHTEASRAKMRLSQAGKPSPHRGRKLSNETRAKISAAQKANPQEYPSWGKARREKLHRATGSPVLGAHYAKGKYRSRISVNGVVTYLGSFSTPEEAHAAYCAALARAQHISARYWESAA